MTDGTIYKNIAERTGGEIHVGVVGPVRTGKSTFIKRFMELFVVPGIENTYVRSRSSTCCHRAETAGPSLRQNPSSFRRKR